MDGKGQREMNKKKFLGFRYNLEKNGESRSS